VGGGVLARLREKKSREEDPIGRGRTGPTKKKLARGEFKVGEGVD